MEQNRSIDDVNIDKVIELGSARSRSKKLYDVETHEVCMIKLTRNQIRELIIMSKWKELLEALKPVDDLLSDRHRLFKYRTQLQYNLHARHNWMAIYLSWSLFPSIEQMTELLNHIQGKIVLELGSGSGLWVGLSQASGCKVYATDISKPKFYSSILLTGGANPVSETYIDVELLPASEALVKYGSSADVFFICWGNMGRNIQRNTSIALLGTTS